MPIHEDVLRTAVRLCRSRNGWTFRVGEVVRALPHLNPSSVRTHIVSRCCINAPKNHPHKWDYFRRVGRGEYEIQPGRRGTAEARTEIKESPAVYGHLAPLGDLIHAVVRRSGRFYVGECLEAAVVSQGATLDELVANLRAAIDLHLEGEDLSALGFDRRPRLSITFEESLGRDAEA